MGVLNPQVSAYIGDDLAGLIEDVRLTGETWLKLQAKLQHLDHMRKVRLSELREGYRTALEENGEKVTEARLDDLARRSDDYREILRKRYETALQEAEANTLHFAKRNAMDALIEKMRQDRTEMRFHQHA